MSPPVLLLLLLASSTVAFSPRPSTLAIKCSSRSVCPHEKIPPIEVFGFQRRAVAGGNKMSMPPFLKQLGSKKTDGGVESSSQVMEISGESSLTGNANDEDDEGECVVAEEELSETQKLLKQVKEAGTAGVISYALWELGFWALSVPVCVFGYYEVTGHLPDLSNKEDTAKLGAEAFAFVNFARFAVPLRIGLALGTTPWIQANVVDKFLKKDEVTLCVEDDDSRDQV